MLPTSHDSIPEQAAQLITTELGYKSHVDESPLPVSDDTHSPPSHIHSSEVTNITAADLPTKGPLSHTVSGSFDHNGGLLTSKSGDLKLTIPKGAIKDGDSVTLCIASDLYGPFMFPSICQVDVVSPYYWIGVTGSYHFQMPVQVEFEHFAVVTACDPSHYQLLTCEDDDESYVMQPAVGCNLSFTIQDNISWCTFCTEHFCSYCLSHNCEDPIVNRIAALYLKTKDFQYLNYFTVEIWFTFVISHCLKRNEELYIQEEMVLDKKSSYIFEASCDKQSTSYFTLTYHQDVNGWDMKHSRSNKVKTKEINFYNYYKNKKELEAVEKKALFPQRFIVNVRKRSECNMDLDTEIRITLHNSDEIPESVFYNLLVPVSIITNVTPNTQKGKTVSLAGKEERQC